MTEKQKNQWTTRTDELNGSDISLCCEEIDSSACGCCSNINCMSPEDLENFLNEIKEEHDASMGVSSFKQ